MKKLSQSARVLRMLRRHPDGVCQAEFLLPNVLDGGHPITRLAARVRDLKDEGYEIVVAGERYSCAVYKIVEAASPPPAPPELGLEPDREFVPMDENATPDPLFDMPPVTRSPYEDAA